MSNNFKRQHNYQTVEESKFGRRPGALPEERIVFNKVAEVIWKSSCARRTLSSQKLTLRWLPYKDYCLILLNSSQRVAICHIEC